MTFSVDILGRAPCRIQEDPDDALYVSNADVDWRGEKLVKSEKRPLPAKRYRPSVPKSRFWID